MAQFGYKEAVVAARTITDKEGAHAVYAGTWGQVLGGDYRGDSDDYRLVFVDFFTARGLVSWRVAPDALRHAFREELRYDVYLDKEIDFRA